MKFDVVEKMYHNKKSNYFSLERELFKEQVKENNLNILDIGCGYGILGSYFKRNQNFIREINAKQSSWQATHYSQSEKYTINEMIRMAGGKKSRGFR
jgi:2-polyprenyl-3-methyl-5-hydroxy-6-metoxy-1,4-benzoquinol methylase